MAELSLEKRTIILNYRARDRLTFLDIMARVGSVGVSTYRIVYNRAMKRAGSENTNELLKYYYLKARSGTLAIILPGS